MEKVKIASFLKERKIIFKPIEANDSGLQRIEKIDFNGNIFLAPIKTNTNMILIKKGDLVISGINVEKGALAIYNQENDVLASIHYSAYEFDHTQIDILYLKYFLKSQTFRRILCKQSGNGIKTEIKSKHLLPLEIFLPSLEQQKEIVKKIQSVENDIESLNNEIVIQNSITIDIRQSILQQAAEGKLVPQNPNDEPASVLLEKIKAEKEKLIFEKKIKKQKPLPSISDEEKPFELPQRWEWCRLSDLCIVITDGDHLPPPQVEKGIPFVVISNIIDNTINLTKTRYVKTEYYNNINWDKKPQISDILFTVTGSYGIPIQVINEYLPFCFQRHIAILKFRLIESKFMYHWLLSPIVKHQCDEKATGIAQKTVSLNVLRNMIIPLPPLAEQQRIVEKVDKLMTLCDELEQEVSNAKKYASQLMETVLQEAFTNTKNEDKAAKNITVKQNIQKTEECKWAAAARGKIKQSTMESIIKRANEIANEENLWTGSASDK